MVIVDTSTRGVVGRFPTRLKYACRNCCPGNDSLASPDPAHGSPVPTRTDTRAPPATMPEVAASTAAPPAPAAAPAAAASSSAAASSAATSAAASCLSGTIGRAQHEARHTNRGNEIHAEQGGNRQNACHFTRSALFASCHWLLRLTAAIFTRVTLGPIDPLCKNHFTSIGTTVE